MKISCGVAEDLLPLYVDGCCSEAAHERTDNTVTAEMVKHDDDIMNDPDF